MHRRPDVPYCGVYQGTCELACGHIRHPTPTMRHNHMDITDREESRWQNKANATIVAGEDSVVGGTKLIERRLRVDAGDSER